MTLLYNLASRRQVHLRDESENSIGDGNAHAAQCASLIGALLFDSTQPLIQPLFLSRKILRRLQLDALMVFFSASHTELRNASHCWPPLRTCFWLTSSSIPI